MGIGSEINQTDLALIAGYPQNMYSASSFDEEPLETTLYHNLKKLLVEKVTMPCFEREQVNIVKKQGDLVSTSIWCFLSIIGNLEESKKVMIDNDTWSEVIMYLQ